MYNIIVFIIATSHLNVQNETNDSVVMLRTLCNRNYVIIQNYIY